MPESRKYFIQDRRQYIGNCVLWWRENSQGYTCNLDEAGVYTEEEVKLRICRDTDVAWPVQAVLGIATLHVEGGTLVEASKKLGLKRDGRFMEAP